MRNLNFIRGEFLYFSQFLSSTKAQELLDYFLSQKIDYWESREIKIFGKTYISPRLERYIALDSSLKYAYSGKELNTNPWEPKLDSIINELRSMGYDFNAVLINYYRNGMDSNGWHSDNEKELGLDPVIASVSLGAERRFSIKSKDQNENKRILLEHGSLLVMGEGSQVNYKHQLPKMPKLDDPRINLTFRQIVQI